MLQASRFVESRRIPVRRSNKMDHAASLLYTEFCLGAESELQCDASFLVFAGTVPRPVITLYYSALSAHALLARSISAISQCASVSKKNSPLNDQRTANRFETQPHR